MPEKPRPRRGLSPGSAARLRSSRPVEPKVAAREHQAVGAHLAVGLGDRVEQALGVACARRHVLAVADAPAVAVAVAVAVQGVGLAAGAHVRPGVDGGAQVGEVHGLLGPVLAADVAGAAQPAGLTRRAVQVAGAVVVGLARAIAEGHGERRALGLQAGDPRRFEQRARLGRAIRPRVALGALHRFDGVVVAVEVRGRQRQAVGGEGRRVLAQHDVGVDERPAPQPAGGDRVETLEVVVLRRARGRPCAAPTGPRATCAAFVGRRPAATAGRARVRAPRRPPAPGGRRRPSRRSPIR